MKTAEQLLNSRQAKKMIANLEDGYRREKSRMCGLVEFNFIQELPKKQKDLFDLLYNASAYDYSADFAIKLINNRPIKWAV